MKETVKINWFKIKEEVISRISEGGVYEYRFIRMFESDREYYGEVGKRKGVSIDKDNRRFVSCEELENDPVVEKIGKISFSDLFEETQERLLSRILKEVEFKINLLLRKNEKKLADFIVYPYARTEVRKFGDNFYLVVNISHRCISKRNIWDLVERNSEELRSLIGKRLINIINPKMEKSFKIEQILNPDPRKTEWIINYLVVEKGYVNSVKELERKIGRIDYNQPIMRSQNGLDFIPQCSALVFNLEELPQELRREFRKHTLVKNEERGRVLESIVKKFSDRLDDFPLAVEAIQLNQPKLLVRRSDNNEEEIKNTSRIFSWIWRDAEDEEIYLPFEVPELIKGSSIPTFILIDDEVGSDVYEKVTKIFKKYNRIAERDTRLPRFDFRRKRYVFSRREIEKILSKIREIKRKGKFNLAFAIIIGKEKYKEHDYYESLKRQLFQLNIISQNILEKTLENRYAINNLLIQILSKLGVKYFALKSRSPYDYILGVDIGKHEYGHRIGGCVVIFDSEGKIKRIQPVKSLAPGETLDLPRVIEFLINKTDLELKDKNILILRDGTVKQQEKQDLVEISRKYTTKITVMGVVKTCNHIILTDNLYNIAVNLNNFTLLLPHRTEGARPIRIDEKIEVNGGRINIAKLSGNDLQLLVDLTRLNYTSLFGDEKSLKLPAPVHYADKFVKALEKEWKIENNLLKEGFLYFI